MGKWSQIGARTAASGIIAVGGMAMRPAVDETPLKEMPAMEEAADVATHVGEVADDISSAHDVAEKTETVTGELTSDTNSHSSPEADPDGADPQQVLLDLEGSQEEERLKKAKEDVERGDGEEVSSGNITAPTPPVDEESAVTSEEQAAAREEESFGSPAEESGPADEIWAEDDADVDDPQVY